MSIVLLYSHLETNADFIQTAKTAAFLQKKLKKAYNFAQEIIVVIPSTDMDNFYKLEEIVHFFNPDVKLTYWESLEPDEEERLIESSFFSIDDFEEEIIEAMQALEVPRLYFPEQSNHANSSYDKEPAVLSGFNEQIDEVVVFPGQDFSAEEAFNQLPSALKKYLTPDHSELYTDYQQHRETHSLTYCNSLPHATRPPYVLVNSSNELTSHPWKCPSTFLNLFLYEHAVFRQHTNLSQDIICFGESLKKETKTLETITPKLQEQGYTDISLVNLDDASEDIIFTADAKITSRKHYRILYSQSLAATSLSLLPILANDLVAVSSFPAFFDAISQGKLVSYGQDNHESVFCDSYLKNSKRTVRSRSTSILASPIPN